MLCLCAAGSAFQVPFVARAQARGALCRPVSVGVLAHQRRARARTCGRAGAPQVRGAQSLRAQMDAADELLEPSDSGVAVPESPVTALFQCPQCRAEIRLEDAACANCGAPFDRTPSFVDLTPESTAKKNKDNSLAAQATRNPFLSIALSQLGAQLSGQPLRQELFRTPVVSYLYERGWRESFKQAGFPGIEKEYDLAMDFFEAARGKTVMDLSCGSGLMVRRFANSGAFGKVIAVDYSESMLEEVQRRKDEEQCPDFDLVRADVACLPFASNAVDAIHSGAALHCWPYVQDGLKEVHRVLAPGGTFFATTFLWGIPDELIWAQANLDVTGTRRAYRFFAPDELEWLMKGAGFSDVQVERRSRCAIIRCVK